MKKINSLLIVLIFSTFIYCQSTKNETENMDKIEKVQIKSVDFSIMTFLSVECDKFEEYFKEYKIISLTDTAVINELLNKIDEVEPIDSTYSKKIDTRAKIDLFSKNDTNTICVGNLTLHMNNSVYKTPQELIDFIEKIE
jgi:hypothetical protein